MKRALEYGLVIVIVVLVASIFRPITLLNRNKYRAEIRGLYERLQPGMARAQAQTAVKSGSYPNLQFGSDNAQTWSIWAPLEFGAQNWVLLIEFEGEHVSALRVRTADSYQSHPPEAPPDKVAAERKATLVEPEQTAAQMNDRRAAERFLTEWFDLEDRQKYSEMYSRLSQRYREELRKTENVQNAAGYERLRRSSEARWFGFKVREIKVASRSRVEAVVSATVEETGERESVEVRCVLQKEAGRWTLDDWR